MRCFVMFVTAVCVIFLVKFSFRREGVGLGGEELGPLFPNFLDPPRYLKSVKIARRYPSGTSTSKFWKSYSRQHFIVTLDKNPHFTKSGSILKQVWIIFLEKVLDIHSFCHFVKLSNFKCLVSVMCLRLDENDGKTKE